METPEQQARRVIEEAEAAAAAAAPQQMEPPPPLIITGLVVEVRPQRFMEHAVVAVTVRNQIAAATCAVPVDAIPQLIAQLQQAQAEAQGLTVPRNGLVVPGQ